MTGNLLPTTGGESEPDTLGRAVLRGRRATVLPVGNAAPGSSRSDPAAQDRTATWFAGVLSEFEKPLTLYVSRLLHDVERARDVVQDAFFTLLNEDHAGRRSQLLPHLAEWLFTVCRNRALDVKRKERRMRPIGRTPVESFGRIDPAPSPSAALENIDESARAMRALDTLPDNQQEVIRLRFQHALSYKQISAVTGLSVTNVGFLIHTGMARLRKEMKPSDL